MWIPKDICFDGLSTKTDKKITITDNDNIEISNLNRQFLFKHDNVGEPKSVIACKEANKMNSDFNIFAMKARIGIRMKIFLMKNFGKNKILLLML